MQETLPSRPRPRPRPEANGISEATLDKLTPKQEAFVREYLVDLNGTQAAIRAGYSEKSAPVIASQNLRKLNVLRAIEEAFMELGGVTRARIVDELGAIAFADIGDFIDWSNETQQLSTDTKRPIDASIGGGSKPGEEVVCSQIASCSSRRTSSRASSAALSLRSVKIDTATLGSKCTTNLARSIRSPGRSECSWTMRRLRSLARRTSVPLSSMRVDLDQRRVSSHPRRCVAHETNATEG